MPLSACRQSVLLEKCAVLHAEETAGTRAEFRFPARGAVQRYCPYRCPQKVFTTFWGEEAQRNE